MYFNCHRATREARGEGTNYARLFTPGEKKALAKSKCINDRGCMAMHELSSH